MSAERDALREARLPERASRFADDAVRTIIRRDYGLEGTAELLGGESDRNFRFTTRGAVYLFKITHASEAAAGPSLQAAALAHLATNAPTLPVPRIAPALNGELEIHLSSHDGIPHTACLMSFLPGIPLAVSAHADRYGHAIGSRLASLDLALADFRHRDIDRDLLWDSSHAHRVRNRLDAIADDDVRYAVAMALDGFEEHVAPRLPSLRKQPIHNDFNPHNLLVSDDDAPDALCGVIDFGDVIRAPLINDLATAIAYRAFDGRDAIALMAEIASAYNGLLPIETIEFDVLLDLVRARQAMVLAITASRAARNAADSQYVLRNSRNAAIGLRHLSAIHRTDASARLQKMCRSAP